MQQINSKKNDIQIWQRRLDDATRYIERSNKIMTKSAEIENGYSEYKNTVNQDEQLNEKLKKSLELLDKKTKLEKFITAAENIYSNERKNLLTRIAELSVKFDKLPQIREKRDQLLHHQADLEKIEAEIEEKRKQYNQITGLMGNLAALNSELFSATEEIRRKIGMMSHAGATCPLCESELGTDGRSRIEHKLSLELEQKVSQSRENTAQMAKSKSELALLEKELKQKELSFKSDRDNTKQQLAIMEKEIQEAENAGEELSIKKTALQKLEEDIKDRKYAADEYKASRAIEQEQQSLGYDPASHKQIAARKISLQNFDTLYKELSDAKLQYDSQQSARADSETTITRMQSEIVELTKQYTDIAGQITELPKITEQIAQLETQLNSLTTEERNIRDRLAESREKLKQLDLLTIEKQSKEKSLVSCKEDESVFAELARYFSKKGIQALIIEETLPEIENEANLLLGKMTDNRMSLSLAPQRGN